MASGAGRRFHDGGDGHAVHQGGQDEGAGPVDDYERLFREYPLFVERLRMSAVEALALEWEFMLGGLPLAGLGGCLFVLLFSRGSTVSTIVGVVSMLCGVVGAIELLVG